MTLAYKMFVAHTHAPALSIHPPPLPSSPLPHLVEPIGTRYQGMMVSRPAGYWEGSLGRLNNATFLYVIMPCGRSRG